MTEKQTQLSFTIEELDDLFNACQLVEAWAKTRTSRDTKDKEWAKRIVPIRDKIHHAIYVISIKEGFDKFKGGTDETKK